MVILGMLRQVGQIEDPLMGLPVASHKPGPVHCQHHRQILKADVMDESGHRPLCRKEEYTANTGFIPPAASPAAKVTACSSAIPTSKNRSGNIRRKRGKPGAVRHSRGDGHDLRDLFWPSSHRTLRKHIRVAVFFLFRRTDFPGRYIKGAHTVEAWPDACSAGAYPFPFLVST